FHHWPLINTFYVSNEWYTTSFGTDPITGWFKDDPEVVIFGAHIHSPNNEPRSIWQGAFTSLNAPCTNYIEIESGIFLGDSTDGISVSSFPKIGSQAHGQGLIVSVKGSRVTIDNYDFDMCEGHTSLFSVTKLPQTWEFDISKPDKFPYTRARRQNQKTSPVFDASAPSGPVLHRIKIIRIQSTSVEVEFSQARIPLPNPGNEVVHSYRFELINKNSGSVLIRKQWSDFMLTPRLQKPEYTQILGGLESGTIYELRIYAVSSFQDEWNKFIRTGTEAGECSSQYLSTEFTTY
ncbi:MAG: fibronectin type III domain-containing protein, partial [Treponema sp.]|nr:fibronectin type III domain-containing protein [Treponema sp.]